MNRYGWFGDSYNSNMGNVKVGNGQDDLRNGILDGDLTGPRRGTWSWGAINCPHTPGTRDRWCRTSEGSELYTSCHHSVFIGHYLIVTTPGWYIVEARMGNRPFLQDVDGDAYSRSAFDRLERMGQLERHRITMRLDIGNQLSFRVRPHYPKLATDRPFNAVIIGQEYESRW